MPILRSAKKAWRGEEKLWVVFWGWLVGLDIFLSYAIIGPFGNRALTPWTAFEILIAILLCAVYLWQIHILTRCAKNHKSRFVGIATTVFAFLPIVMMLNKTFLNSS